MKGHKLLCNFVGKKDFVFVPLMTSPIFRLIPRCRNFLDLLAALKIINQLVELIIQSYKHHISNAQGASQMDECKPKQISTNLSRYIIYDQFFILYYFHFFSSKLILGSYVKILQNL